MANVVGWDTETTLGYVRLLRGSNGTTLDTVEHRGALTHAPAERPTGERDTKDRPLFETVVVPTLEPLALLDALFEGGFASDYNVFWNVRFDFGSIIKPWVVAQGPALKANYRRLLKLNKELTLVEAKAYVEGGLTSEDRLQRRDLRRQMEEVESVEHFDLGKYRVLYIPKKGFRLTRTARQRGKNSVCFFDAMPFYSTGIEEAAGLDRMARKYLGEHKTAAEEGLDVVELGDKVPYYDEHRDAVMRYCLRDAELTATLFSLTVESFERIGCPFPSQPWSRASVGREYLKRSGVLEATRRAYTKLKQTGYAHLWERAYAGACILMLAAGSWPDVARFDINSAYPDAMRSFPSLEGAYLVGLSNPKFPSCFFKFYEVELAPTPRRALPAKDTGEDRLLYVHGGPTRHVCVTHLDLELFDAFEDPYRIVNGVGVVTPSTDRPLAYMEKLYKRKDKIRKEYGRDSVEYMNIKQMLAATYGILTQSRPRDGRFTNLIYGAYITAACRRKLWLKSLELQRQGGTVLGYMTYGLFVSGLPSVPEASEDLGDWDTEDVGLVTLFANGIYLASGKLKRRGCPDLTVEALMESTETTVTTRKSRPFGLKQAVIQAHPERIGVFLDETKELCPADMLEGAGLRMLPDLRRAPLKDYFTRRWLLEHRRASERTASVKTEGLYTSSTVTTGERP